jgi:hypothetical protein
VRWVDNDGVVKQVEENQGSGYASQISFAGTLQGVPDRSPWKSQVRVAIRGVPPGGTQEAYISAWTDWKDVP